MVVSEANLLYKALKRPFKNCQKFLNFKDCKSSAIFIKIVKIFKDI